MNRPTQILLIEDDPAVAHSLRDGLIILDIRLPDGSGLDFCRQLRQQGAYQPILMLTVQRDEMDKVLGLEMGADDYVTKPYSLRELLSRIRALIRRAYGELSMTDAEMLYVGDLLVDRTRGQVRRGGKQISLTPIEFRLLVFLARHQGQVLTRSQILDAVWGYAADVDSERIVNVHVRRLREKVELDPSEPRLILTVPGIGYRLAS
jgi:DNA-binding response OmpR family regulator